MKNKLVTTITSLLAVIGSTMLPTAPANAASTPWTGSTYTYSVGDNVAVDLSCNDSNIENVEFSVGVLPPGLTMNTSGGVTGSPTTVGTWTLSNYTCTYNGGYSVSGPSINVTFVIEPATAKAPFMFAENLNSANCEFSFTFMIPESQDNGSLNLIVTNQLGTKFEQIITDVFIPSNEVFNGKTPITQLNNLGSTPGVTITGDNPFACGDTLSFTMGYTHLGSPRAETTVSGVTVTNSATINTPKLYVSQLRGEQCSVSFIYPTSSITEGTRVQLRPYGQEAWEASVFYFAKTFTDGKLQGVISLNNGLDNRSNAQTKAANATYLDCSGAWVVGIYDEKGTMIVETPIDLEHQRPICNAGFTSPAEGYTCVPAPIGYYTTALSATETIPCPAGTTTLTTASKSINDCYKPIIQTVTKLTPPKAVKLKAVTYLPIFTNSLAQATATATGACTAKVVIVTTKVKNIQVSTNMLKVTAAKKAGNCTITYTSPAVDKYLALSKVVKIKVSKTGK